jgi:hypothetical protein
MNMDRATGMVASIEIEGRTMVCTDFVCCARWHDPGSSDVPTDPSPAELYSHWGNGPVWGCLLRIQAGGLPFSSLWVLWC